MESQLDEVPGTSLGSPFEEGGRGCRSKRKQTHPTYCPVCKCTLRSTEVDQHLNCELEKLQKIALVTRNRYSNGARNAVSSPDTVDGSASSILVPTDDSTNCNSNNIPPTTGAATTSSSTSKFWETYQKVRGNRQTRQKSKYKRRKNEETVCPICNKETQEEITLHVERCLRRAEGNGSSSGEENIDVEGYEEYEWAGQSRVRVTSLLEGGINILGGTAITNGDEDEDLVVDGDDDGHTYGEAQYSELDVILPGSDTSKEREALRRAVLVGSTSTAESPKPDHHPLPVENGGGSPTRTDGGDEGDKPTTSAIRKPAKNAKRRRAPSTSGNTVPETCANTSDSDLVLEALKSRIRELERRKDCGNGTGGDDAPKCLICLERYFTPVISVCCWHVHCERCWLRTLGAKKLCPQCNMITSPLDLRRIYI